MVNKWGSKRLTNSVDQCEELVVRVDLGFVGASAFPNAVLSLTFAVLGVVTRDCFLLLRGLQ